MDVLDIKNLKDLKVCLYGEDTFVRISAQGSVSGNFHKYKSADIPSEHVLKLISTLFNGMSVNL